MTHEDGVEVDEEDAPIQVAAPLPERTPVDVERQVCAVSRNSSVENICAMLDAADWLLARAKSINQIAKQRAIDWIDTHGPFDIGMIHYNVGHTTTIRCTNPKRCGHELLDRLRGDFDGFLDVLVAQPYKSTAARAILTDTRYGSLFTLKCTSKLVGGVPTRVLKRGDKRFQR